MRILVGTLYTIENELDQCVAALESQEHQAFDHVVLENLPNKVAHDRLYQLFVERASDYDLFLKLDADMVLSDPKTLSWIDAQFASDPALDHLQFPVCDYYSDSFIMGINTFSKRVAWRSVDSELSVDRAWTVPGRRATLRDQPFPLVMHSPDPSRYQAYRFGLHRALKAIQPGVRPIASGPVNLQWALLKKVWDHFVAVKDARLGLALMGAEAVFRRHAVILDYTMPKAAVTESFESVERLSADDLFELLKRKWKHKLLRELRFRWRVGPRFYLRRWRDIPEAAAIARVLGC